MSTFVWLQLVDLIKAENMSREETTALWAIMDLVVNILAVVTQLFGTARLASRFGLVVTLAIIPVFMIAGFAVVALVPLLPVLIGLQILRRAGNYAITRPGREMLFTVVDKESKYKAKNAIDTAVYRGGDAATAQLYNALERVLNFSGIAIIGALLAAIWFSIAVFLGRSYERKSVEEPADADTKALQG
jgi:AAA family ATP:ADP antiporter